MVLIGFIVISIGFGCLKSKSKLAWFHHVGRVFCKKGCDADGETWEECKHFSAFFYISAYFARLDEELCFFLVELRIMFLIVCLDPMSIKIVSKFRKKQFSYGFI